MNGLKEIGCNFFPTILCSGDTTCTEALINETNINLINKKTILVIHPTNKQFWKESNHNQYYNNLKDHDYYFFKTFQPLNLDTKFIKYEEYMYNRLNYCSTYRNIISMISMLIAEKLGFQEIYLLGCDMNNFTNHFYKYKSHTLAYKGDKYHYSLQGYQLVYKAFHLKKKEFDDKIIRVFNCSKESSLNQFDKINFNDLELSNDKIKYQPTNKKIAFYICSLTTIYNVLGICKILNKEDYIVILNDEQFNTNNYHNKYNLSFAEKIFTKFDIEFINKNIYKIDEDIIKKYYYWVFFKDQLPIMNYIKKLTDIQVIFMQVGIINNKQIVKRYISNSDICCLWGKHYSDLVENNTNCHLLPIGFTKLNLYKNLSEEHFIIFTQPYHRFKCNEEEWGYFDIELFFKIIIDSIREKYGNTSKIYLAQHPVAISTKSESYMSDLIKKYNLIDINPSETIDYINNMKIGFTFTSAIALELRAIKKEIILVNTCKERASNKTHSYFFDELFNKYSFKTAYNKNDILNHMNTPKRANNKVLMAENASERLCRYLNIPYN